MQIWYIFGYFGEIWFWLLIIIIFFFIYFILKRRKSKHVLWFKRFFNLFFISILTTYFIVLSLKLIFNIQRICIPCPGIDCNPYCPSDPSFPSGHAAVGFSVFTSIYLLIKRKWIFPIFTIPIMIGYSRIALGVHTLLDVIIGSIIGIGVTFIINEIIIKKGLDIF